MEKIKTDTKQSPISQSYVLLSKICMAKLQPYHDMANGEHWPRRALTRHAAKNRMLALKELQRAKAQVTNQINGTFSCTSQIWPCLTFLRRKPLLKLKAKQKNSIRSPVCSIPQTTKRTQQTW